VQELIDGVDLATEVSNRRPTTEEVLTTLDELLSILEHLHSLAPPVVHRDIKPKNIIRRRDGQLVLIDFGAVKDAVHASFDPGMSLVGTVGYMAPEQLRGQASPAYGARSRGGWAQLTSRLRVAVALHFTGAASISYQTLAMSGVLPRSFDLLTVLFLVDAAAHLSAVVFFSRLVMPLSWPPGRARARSGPRATRHDSTSRVFAGGFAPHASDEEDLSASWHLCRQPPRLTGPPASSLLRACTRPRLHSFWR